MYHKYCSNWCSRSIFCMKSVYLETMCDVIACCLSSRILLFRLETIIPTGHELLRGLRPVCLIQLIIQQKQEIILIMKILEPMYQTFWLANISRRHQNYDIIVISLMDRSLIIEHLDCEEASRLWQDIWLMKRHQDYDRTSGSWKGIETMTGHLNHEKASRLWQDIWIMKRHQDYDRTSGSWKSIETMTGHLDHKRHQIYDRTSGSQSCPRVTFLGPDPRLPSKSVTRPAARPFPHMYIL